MWCAATGGYGAMLTYFMLHTASENSLSLTQQEQMGINGNNDILLFDVLMFSEQFVVEDENLFSINLSG